MVSHLYSLNYDKIFKNVLDYSQDLVKAEYYSNDPKCEINTSNLNDIQNIQALSVQKPNKFIQFFHALNIIMSNTYFISAEQSIQHALLNVRDPEIIELSLSRNKLFDIDNFMGGIHTSLFQSLKLEKFESKTKHELLNENQIKGKLIDFLLLQNKTPVLIWTIDNDKQEFIVIKQHQGDWYFLKQDSNTYKISKKGKNITQIFQNQLKKLISTTQFISILAQLIYSTVQKCKTKTSANSNSQYSTCSTQSINQKNMQSKLFFGKILSIQLKNNSNYQTFRIINSNYLHSDLIQQIITLTSTPGIKQKNKKRERLRKL
ncbi:hypothetical protein OXYTRIMIC_638 [Oxytricha trifallax]|uniref:Uncharacterized protein n=1 Tax=Oxytricha trifallax TaxID=1172189 RepID=A0A073I0W2_9SPIT|nr:hypothetical protein OXYTRIMIC_638 [Oxytricha trifallax]